MNVRFHMFFVSLVVAHNVHGAYEFEFETLNPFESIIVTATNVMIKFSVRHYAVNDPDNKDVTFSTRFSSDYMGDNDALILTPDRRMRAGEKHAGYSFTPVIFKNQYRGFEIMRTFAPPIVSASTPIKSRVWHITLSDTPMEVGEDDVEKIMGKGREWESYKGPPVVMTPEEYARLAETPYPTRVDAGTGNAEMASFEKFSSDSTTEDIEKEDVSQDTLDEAKPPCFWLYALVALALCLCGGVYLFRKKWR